MIGDLENRRNYNGLKRVKKGRLKIPATLLAESLSQTGGDDGGSFGVKLTHLMTAVVVLSIAEVSIATFNLTFRGVQRRLNRPGTAVEPADEVVIGREVSAAA